MVFLDKCIWVSVPTKELNIYIINRFNYNHNHNKLSVL